MRFFVSNRVSKAPMLSTSAINVASRRTCLPPSGPFRSAKLSSCRQRVSPSKVCFINESPSPSGSILGDRILTSLFDMQAYVETSVTFAVTQQAIAFGRFIKMDHSLTHPCMISSCIPSLEVSWQSILPLLGKFIYEVCFLIAFPDSSLWSDDTAHMKDHHSLVIPNLLACLACSDCPRGRGGLY